MKRLCFILSAALLAAAIANPAVESISNSGVLGRGYFDRDRGSVGPTLAIAASFALVSIVLWTIRAFERGSHARGAISAFARDLSRRTPAHDLPFVIAAQFGALYLMERAECLASGGVEPGLMWLGGPVVFAVAAHALTGLAVTFALGRLLRSIARVVVHVAVAVFEAMIAVRACGASLVFSTHVFDAVAGPSLAHVRSTRGRAPPPLQTLA